MPFADITGHEQPISLLQASIRNGRLAHAYLFHGEAKIGKFMTAVRLAQALNCEQPSHADNLDSCGRCRSCLQIAARTYPDYSVIEPDPELATPQIKIEQVREIEQQFVYRPLIGERKICLIDDADRLTIGAANALLKTLEEPPGHSLFVLTTSRPHALPITIRSRCQALRFTTPARTQVEAALILTRELSPADARFLAVLTDGRIGEALTTNAAEVRARQQECLALVKPESLTSSTTVLSAAESLAKTDRGEETLNWLTRWIRDLVIVIVGGDQDQILHDDQLAELRRYAQRADIDTLLTLLNDIERIEQQATRHLNMQMALETTFLRLREALGLVPAGASA
ncbi:MAG: DNA polymerase III subunit delta' [Nitrospira sp. BO4]|jgi:DNA polymerase-3 subunit delta'|nr:DNA polymerase III subunit delta' [Nitrospira sp. BO4]